jgi:hypothetical protein
MRIFPDGKLIELKHLGQVISISTIALSKRSQYQAPLSQANNAQNPNSKPPRPAQKDLQAYPWIRDERPLGFVD